MVDQFFNPSQRQYGSWVQRAWRPYLAVGNTGGLSTDVGQACGFIRAVLRYECGAGLTVAANPGPWTFTQATSDALKGVQSLFGLPQTGRPDAATWSAIDTCVLF